MWTKGDLIEKLKAHAAERQATRNAMSTPKTEQAAVLYARWQGLTEEPNAIRQGAKSKLDELIDTMEPEEWLGVDGLAEALGDDTYKGLLKYGMQRALASTTDMARTVAKAPDWPIG